MKRLPAGTIPGGHEVRPYGPCRVGSVVLLVLVLCVGCGGVPDAEEATAEPGTEAVAQNLLLITVDTWRGDHFATTRAGEDLTPELSRFARGAVRFTAAQSVGNATSPGVAGILTGWFPFRSGVVENRSIIPSRVTTLATRLKRAGYETAAFVSNPVIGPGFGFEQGFERYELLPRRGHKVPGEAITEAAIDWLENRRRQDPFFLWLHPPVPTRHRWSCGKCFPWTRLTRRGTFR